MGRCGKTCPSILLVIGIILFLSSFSLDSLIRSKIDQELAKVNNETITLIIGFFLLHHHYCLIYL